LYIFLSLALTCFVVGSLGMAILLDTTGSSSLAQTQFGQLYKRLVAVNPFFSAFFFNGGLIGCIFCMKELTTVRKVQQASPTMQEAKKDK